MLNVHEMKKYVISMCLLICFGCASPYEKPIAARAVLTAYAVGDMNTQMSDGVNEWCEWHDGATFRIEQPEEWNGTTLTIFFPSEVSNSPLRAVVGTAYEFVIDEQYLKAAPGAQIFDGALRGLKEIEEKSNQ